MLVRAAFIESAVCHHVKIRILADQSNNFVEMVRCIHVTSTLWKICCWSIKATYRKNKRRTNEKRRYTNFHVTCRTEKNCTSCNYIVMFFAVWKTNRERPSSVNASRVINILHRVFIIREQLHEIAEISLAYDSQWRFITASAFGQPVGAYYHDTSFTKRNYCLLPSLGARRDVNSRHFATSCFAALPLCRFAVVYLGYASTCYALYFDIIVRNVDYTLSRC